MDDALRRGLRGLRDGSSVARLLSKRRGVRNQGRLPPLFREDIFRWAEAHRQRTGKWPAGTSGPISEAPGETWKAVEMALFVGLRGLPGGLTLKRFLGQQFAAAP